MLLAHKWPKSLHLHLILLSLYFFFSVPAQKCLFFQNLSSVVVKYWKCENCSENSDFGGKHVKGSLSERVLRLS